MTVDPSGVFLQDSASELIDSYEVGIQYGDGLIYASDRFAGGLYIFELTGRDS